MKERKFLNIVMCLLMVATVFTVAVPMNVVAQPIYVWVDDDFDENTLGWGVTHFDKIQDGINAVAVDGTVHVNAGTYYESVTITKALTLEGEDTDMTTLENPGNLYPSGIISYWKFDENSGTIAFDSVGTNDGTIYGATWTAGQVGGALSFDGIDDWIKIPASPSTASIGTKPFTVAAWAKTSIDPDDDALVAQSPAGQNEDWALDAINDQHRFFVRDTAGVVHGIHGGVVPNDEWFFQVGVWDGSEIQLYVNGDLKNAVAVYEVDTEEDRISIGARNFRALEGQTPNYGPKYWNGLIDEVIIYDRALTSTEIMQHYNDGLLGQPYHGLGTGIISEYNSDVTIKNLNIQGFDRGIYLSDSNNNNIIGNTVSNNDEGITLFNSDNNIITDNSILNNQLGLSLDHSNGNTLHHNNIIGNTNQLSLISSLNTWDDGIGEGNYWSDYTGLDDGSGGRVLGDGVGDTELPYPGIVVEPLSYWKLDEGSGTTAIDSADANHGSLEPTDPPVWTTGQVGGALSFDGINDWIKIPASPSTASIGTKPFTVAAWAKTSINPDDDALVAQCREVGYGDWTLDAINDQHRFVVRDAAGVTYGMHGGVVPNDEWFFQVGVWDGSEIQLYVNGNLKNAVAVPSIITDEDRISIGARNFKQLESQAPPYYTKCWDGLIDEIIIYDRALTSTEIMQLYNDGLAGIEITPDANTIGLWHLDEGSGSTATDSSTNNNHGILQPSGPIWTIGQVGNALSFDGVDDYVNVPQVFSGDGDITMSAWIKFESISYSGFPKVIFTGKPLYDKAIQIFQQKGSGQLGVGKWGGPNAVTTEYYNDGNWHHVVARYYNGNTYDIFVDGEFKAINYGTYNIPSDGVTWIGGRPSTEYWDGLIDEVAVYDRVLTPEEIQQHYNDGLLGIPISVSLGVDWYPLVDPNPNTPSGSDVGVLAGDGVEMQFSNVISPGFTYAEQVTGTPPPNFKLVPVKTFYDISTTATFDGIIIISIPYDDTGIKPQKESNLKLMHWNEASGVWEDITTWVDTENNIIYGETTSLSIFAIMYENKPPIVTITGPVSGSLYIVGSSVEFTGSFTDEDIEDTHTAQWTFTSQGVPVTIDGTITEQGGSGSITDTYTFTETGVYLVKLTVWDNDDGEGTSEKVDDLSAMVVIYDPEGGFVTGGGWINSPEGAYEPDPSLTGKASFGFVAKYKKGASEPMGNTEFKFEVADLDFHSTNYDWLVIAGATAQFKGTGTINDVGEYKFKLWATDGDLLQGGSPDKFRIKIWQEDESGIETVIYDNKVDTELGGGQIVIHNG